MKTLLILSLVTAISACTGRTIYMQNERGEKTSCDFPMVGAIITGTAIRDAQIDQCVEDKKAKGFKVMDAEGFKIIENQKVLK